MREITFHHTHYCVVDLTGTLARSQHETDPFAGRHWRGASTARMPSIEQGLVSRIASECRPGIATPGPGNSPAAAFKTEPANAPPEASDALRETKAQARLPIAG